MKEASAVRRTTPPSVEIEYRIEQTLSVGAGKQARESLSAREGDSPSPLTLRRPARGVADRLKLVASAAANAVF
jgi:hypothetical protein